MSAASLSVRDLSWGPGRGTTLLHPTSFDVAPGQVLAVVGANGAGKSTLLRLLYRFLKPTSGNILIGGDDLWQLDARAAARRIAAVLQEQPTDFALTVREIVALGRTPHRSGFAAGSRRDREIIDHAIIQLGLVEFSDRDFGTLSGGERQRVMVARALAQEPEVLILDEPTNHLDIRHQLEVLHLVRTLGHTIITSLHDLNFAARYADRTLILSHGQPLAFGTPEEVLTDALIARAFNVGTRIQTLHPGGQSHFSFHL
jgi:iron complex transport system ATP-binding protein